ncbi:MAG TPA: cupin domain-containing protein [Steroidobacter sp.]
MCLASIVMSEVFAPEIVSFATSRPTITRCRPPRDRLLVGDPEHVTRQYFSDSTGCFSVGVWESTPGRWRVSYTRNEFSHLTRGRLRIEGTRGGVWEFSAGDWFVIPAGFSGTCAALEPVSRLYVLCEPAPQ